jgi:hypothetical protein
MHREPDEGHLYMAQNQTKVNSCAGLDSGDCGWRGTRQCPVAWPGWCSQGHIHFEKFIK